MRAEDILVSIVLLLMFWGLALLVALDDVDFFSLSDLFDFDAPHHEHIVATLGFLGLVAAAIPLLRGIFRQPSF